MAASRALIILILTFTVAWLASWLMSRDGGPTTLDPEAKNEPDLYMVNAIIDQYDERGQPKHKIKALKLTHYPATDITTLEMQGSRFTTKTPKAHGT